MAIIIPSSHYYEATNNKLCNNQISGVSYKEHTYSLVTEIAANVGTLSFSNSSNSVKYYGDWLYNKDGTGQRYEVITYSKYYQNTKNFTNLNKFDLTETYITGYLNSSSIGKIEFNIPQIKTNFYKVKIPLPNLSDEQLQSFVKFLASNIVHLSYLTSPYIMMIAPTKITINIETGRYENGNWQILNSIEKYSVSFTESIYDVIVGRKTTKDKTVAFNVGENTDYSLSSTNFLSNGSKVNGEQLGQYISEEIISNYEDGKETASMTCIIGNYFDENGNKVISIDDGKMTFELYDEVVPMFYTNLGDRPISLTEDGKAKIFKVLKSRIFYDGAVWQELTLQETGETVEILNSLSAPRISINGDILNITRTNNENQTFDIYINNALHTTTTSTELDLSTLNLSYGTYSIYVISKAQGFSNSKASNVETYILKPYIIEAGTYIFNEVLQVDKRASCGDMGGDIIVNFYNGEQPISSTIIQIDFVPTSSLSIIHSGGSIYMECSEGTWTYTVQNIIEESVHRGTIPEEYLETCRTFYIREAIEVSKDFYNVFMENVIKIQ